MPTALSREEGQAERGLVRLPRDQVSVEETQDHGPGGALARDQAETPGHTG